MASHTNNASTSVEFPMFAEILNTLIPSYTCVLTPMVVTLTLHFFQAQQSLTLTIVEEQL